LKFPHDSANNIVQNILVIFDNYFSVRNIQFPTKYLIMYTNTLAIAWFRSIYTGDSSNSGIT